MLTKKPGPKIFFQRKCSWKFELKISPHCKPIPCNENRVFPAKFSHREIPVMKTGVPAMRTGVPCNKNRFFPVWKTSQGIPCTGPVRNCSEVINVFCFKNRSDLSMFETIVTVIKKKFQKLETEGQEFKKKKISQ